MVHPFSNYSSYSNSKESKYIEHITEYIQVHMDMYTSIESTAHTDDDGQTKHALTLTIHTSVL